MAKRFIRTRLSVAAALLLVASCGGASDEKFLADTCDKGSATKQSCTCIAKDLKANLSAEDYDFYVKLMKEQMKLAKKTAGMTAEEAMEASKGAAQDVLSDSALMSRIGKATDDAMNKCLI